MPHCAIALLVALVISLVPVVARAQLRGHIPQLGVLDPSPQQRPAPCLPAFQQGLRDLGYVEGQNLHIDYRHAEGHPDRLPALAAELVQHTPDVLWLHSNPTAWAAKRATTTIPIVTAVSNEPSALFVHKILQGAKPADLPIERATLQFVINLKTAQALDVTIPAALLFQADEVIR
jgi:putative tryptophan/tyrosine transport system substrate-binding protein